MRFPWFLLALLGCETRIDVGALEHAPGQLRVLDAGGPLGDTGLWPSLALGPDGARHVAYCDLKNGDVHYATHRADQLWKASAVITEGAVGKYTALALDAQGAPWIAYYDQDRGELRVTHKRDATWSVEKIAWGLEVGVGMRLLGGKKDAPELYFYAPDGTFRRARRDGDGAWHDDTLSPATFGPQTRAGLMSTLDGPWLSFVDWNFKDKELVLAEPFGQQFAMTRLPLGTDAGFATGVFVDAGEPRVMYVRRGALHVAGRSRDGWTSERLLDDVGAFAVAQSESGELSVAVQDVSLGSSRLLLLRRTLLGGWQRFLIDAEGPVADHLSVVLDERGKTTVAYHAQAIRGLKLYEE